MKPKLFPLLFPLIASPLLAGLPGPELVKDIRPGNSGSMELGGTPSFGGTSETLFIGANNGSQGKELWKSDGTTGGTVMIKDLCSGAHGGNPRYFMTAGNFTFFTGHDLTHGNEIWRTDGTPAGTLMLKDIVTGTDSSSYPQLMGTVGNTLYFTADAERQLNGDLWKSDGTPGGTVKVTAINPGGRASLYSGVALGGTFYFYAFRDTTELWRTDGTMAGTRLVSKADSAPVVAGNRLFFCFKDATHGRELWTSDGTPEGTSIVEDINADITNRGPSGMIASENLVYFSAQASDDPSSWALWRSDGSAEGTFPLLPLADGFYGSFHTKGDHLYFAPKLRDGTTGIWKSDGTVAGTQLLKPGITGTSVKFLSSGDKDFYLCSSLVGQLWQSDGTAGGTRMVADLFMGSSGFGSEAYPRTVNGKLMFGIHNPATGKELYCFNTMAPSIAPAVVSKVSTTGVRVAVGVNPNGLGSSAKFEYGPTESYGSTKPVVLAGGEFIARFQDVPLELSGLNAGTLYHYRITATNKEGTRVSTGTFRTAFTRRTWQDVSFGAQASTAISADDQDPDGDGLSNLIEYAFALDPNRGDVAGLPKPGTSAEGMVFEFTHPEGQEDLIYGVEWSPSMAPGSWTAVPDSGSGNYHRFVVATDQKTRVFARWTVTSR
ncbi:hypothetical protein OKA05_05390 [Luteolibacter arcticus]|uniref:Fibronectin type-III domain-containing protein n=1 Tax=Luteolibacter arcticus TaxID=1581411 RepID=A0ABT3GED0_9BACT|nr:hypothetical protein [Luteolibacter arcticus]MCW1921975.1 hypothetical protein [Luteolibacter arcticus]